MTTVPTPPVAAVGLPSAHWLVGGILITATVALGIAVRAPLTTTVLGLIAFGVLHNVLEIRYVAGRFAQILTGRFLALLLIMITGIVGCRLAAGYVGESAGTPRSRWAIWCWAADAATGCAAGDW